MRLVVLRRRFPGGGLAPELGPPATWRLAVVATPPSASAVAVAVAMTVAVAVAVAVAANHAKETKQPQTAA